MAKNQFRGGGYGGMNQAAMMKQAQKMQQDLLKMQEDLENQVYTATAGGGVVRASVSGKREVTEIVIDPDAVDPDDVEMLQDMVMAAVNEALRKAEDASNQSMSRITGSLGNLGGLF
jgi:DNA-binding YbaB/EbfC family protein